MHKNKNRTRDNLSFVVNHIIRRKGSTLFDRKIHDCNHVALCSTEHI